MESDKMNQNAAKLLVAKRALDFISPGMALGLGTGTTATMFIRELGSRNAASPLDLRCVASSDASHKLATSLGLKVTRLDELPELDLYIDGADEVDAQLNLIKGGGGAMLREKIVASSSKRFIVVVDSTKVVKTLGKFPLPLEVIKMALPLVLRRLSGFGLQPKQRMHADGSVYLTDEGNFVVDCHCGAITDPAKIAAEVRSIVGVVEHGLFLGMAERVLVAGEQGVTELTK
jgi:ribose 5-phosphate isomerase A